MSTASSLLAAALAVAAVALAPLACSRATEPPAVPDAAPPPAEEEPDAAPPPPPKVELGQHAVTVRETRRVVPGPGFPAEVAIGNSNNNLDVLRFGGRVYFAFRTSKDHYASDATAIYVVSSENEADWRFEARFKADGDLREPRFLELGGELLLYVARLGVDPLKFEPKGTLVSRRGVDGTWSSLADIGKPGAIAWRTRVERGVPYMTAYLGGEHIYDFSGAPLSVELLTTRDGMSWTALPGAGDAGDAGDATVYRGGGSESDFTLDDDGALYAVIRNEAGDATGFGSKVCTAPAGALASWKCVSDPKKYDSPLVFRVGSEIYLVGRRNLTETGNYDLGRRDLTIPGQELTYQLDYRGKPKRCSLWRFVKGESRVAYVLDLPSKGDTCFAGVLPGATPEERVLYNYSSDLDLPGEPTWGQGQIGPTHIYRHVLRFEPR